MSFELMADEVARLGGAALEHGEDIAVQWARIELYGEQYLMTRRTAVQDGATIYAHRPMVAGEQRGLLLQFAMATNLETVHGMGPVYCLDDGSDQLVAVVSVPFAGTHAGEVLDLLESVACQLREWTNSGLLEAGAAS